MKKRIALLLVLTLFCALGASAFADSGFDFKTYLYDLEYPPHQLIDTRSASLTAAPSPFRFGLEVDQDLTLDQLMFFVPEASEPVPTLLWTRIRDAEGNFLEAADQPSGWLLTAGSFEEETCYRLDTPSQPLLAGTYSLELIDGSVYINEQDQIALLATERGDQNSDLQLTYLSASELDALLAPTPAADPDPEPTEDEDATEQYKAQYLLGYHQGYDEQFALASESGYEAGLTDARDGLEAAEQPLTVGKPDSFPEGMEPGQDAEQGYSDGYESGSQAGLADGFAAGYLQGYSEFEPEEGEPGEEGEEGQEQEVDVPEQEELPLGPQPEIPAPLSLFIGDALFEQEQPLLIQDGRSLVALRPLLEHLGFEVQWQEEAQRIDIFAPEQTFPSITLWLDSTVAQVYDPILGEATEQPLDVSAQLIDGRCVIPLRFVAERLGFEVVWDEEVSCIYLYTP